jgi:imidazoleglycerol phosphate synthase glutamine amidotransferase subunit HisH
MSAKMNTIKCLNVAVQNRTWRNFAVDVFVTCSKHKVVNHDWLFMCGSGWIGDTDKRLSKYSCNQKIYFPPSLF